MLDARVGAPSRNVRVRRLGLVALLAPLLACRPDRTPPAESASAPAPAPAVTLAPLPADPEAVVVSPLAEAGWVGSQACMPCHPTIHGEWDASSHAHTIRKASLEDEDLLASIIPCSDMTVTHALGDRHEVRFLHERPEVGWGQGRFLALPCSWRPHEKAPEVHHGDDWKTRPFESACAACHVTGFRKDHGFLEIGVGCESCHGPGGLHVKQPGKGTILGFAGHARDEVTVCASCHLQDGVSKRTGLKFPDGYVPGGSLLDDFKFDWTLLDHAAVEKALDVHQKILVRRIVHDGDDSLRCTSCHSMHGLGHEKHRALPQQDYCGTCHQPDMTLKEYSQQCNVCEF
jgi:hypothetical protein